MPALFILFHAEFPSGYHKYPLAALHYNKALHSGGKPCIDSGRAHTQILVYCRSKDIVETRIACVN